MSTSRLSARFTPARTPLALAASILARIALLSLTPLAAEVCAQTSPLPGSVQPGQIERDLKPAPAPRAIPDGALIPVPGIKAPAGADGIRFPLREITFSGNTRIASAVLRAEAQPYLGREVTLAELYALAERVTARYRNEGYVLSQAIVPAQEVQQGVTRIEVVEGFINAVRFEGDTRGDRRHLEHYAERIRASRPLHAQALERYLLLMNDLAGVTARATLMPATEQVGAADLVIQLSQKVAAGAVSIDNRAGRFLGPWRAYADLDVHSLTRRFDKTAIRAATSMDERLNYVAATHEQPLGGEGGRIGVTLGYSRAEPRLEGAFANANLETEALSGAISYTHPLIRSRRENLYGRVSFGFHDGRTELLDQTTAQDKLRVVRAGATYDLADPLRGVNVFDLEFSQGLDVLGARESGSPDLSRANGRSDFSKGTLYAARLQSLAAGWSILAAMSGQYAANPLLASELFGFGGSQFGRGYDPSELVGDSGIAGKVELRYTGNAAIGPGTPLNYTAYAFYDVGRVWRRAPVNEASAESAASYGLGLRVEVARRITGVGEIAKPATRDVRAEADRDLRGYVGLAYKF